VNPIGDPQDINAKNCTDEQQSGQTMQQGQSGWDMNEMTQQNMNGFGFGYDGGFAGMNWNGSGDYNQMMAMQAGMGNWSTYPNMFSKFSRRFRYI
jgi:hypothetical protein